MAIASKAETIGVIIISLAVGVIFHYFFSHLPKNEKKKYTDELISQLINFILFIWVGKILLSVSLFVQDPLAVLAYPGDSNAFYLAVLFTAIIIIYKTLRKNLNLFVFAEALTYVFLISLFIYEFLQLVLKDDIYSLGYLILSGILLIIFFFIHDRIKLFSLLMMILTGWTVGVLILNYIYPFVAVFGYLLGWGFIITFFIFCGAILILYEKKGRS
ncbi:hypothetical protein NSQ77_02965 [Oceanobacillus sp. FSL K6-2867]|uniref:hypothetical protein n=1 Tax=Oceanobacillus sp. FSL K6-2867 TaxID=2954748 RepID=UPI0030D9FB03